MRLTDFDELVVVDARGKTVGRIARALFDPADPVLVGFEVRMRPLGHLLERPRRYVPRSDVTIASGQATLAEKARLERADQTRSDIDWEQVVIWLGMPVRTAPGKLLGEVKDAELDTGGRVSRLVLTRGATSDVAIGVREVPGESVLGFADGAVRIDDAVDAPEFSGGMAASAGKGAAVAKVGAERAAASAVSAAVVAARAAKRSSLAKRASSSWKGFTEGIRKGMAEDEEDSGR
ncbi:MAG: PRC-barrel domain-containing protein [Anaerosomatales bacterium]